MILSGHDSVVFPVSALSAFSAVKSLRRRQIVQRLPRVLTRAASMTADAAKNQFLSVAVLALAWPQ
jgi:hypothetical protein